MSAQETAQIARKAWLGARVQFIAALLIIMAGVALNTAFSPENVPTLLLQDPKLISGVFFPVLIGAAGMVGPGRSSGPLYTLALPVSRRSMVLARVGVGLLGIAILYAAAFLAIAIGTVVIGKSVTTADLLAYALCAFFGASVFFSLALFLSTLFTGRWPPILIAMAIALTLSFLELSATPPAGFHRTLNALDWVETGTLPWLGFLLCAATSAILILAAIRSFERRDF